ncbi:MAG: hypothetical protein A3C53_06135 [Omnitrophica WOR_2 bacterium RIFCSPHIGHO2_02_FULL_68_15]|nr:MAG: hypothetical protein A3C53_06135 [Omnitrophica WOR_2 bacterium RIFCSPHIGHO2_02_FULL_68_15]
MSRRLAAGQRAVVRRFPLAAAAGLVGAWLAFLPAAAGWAAEAPPTDVVVRGDHVEYLETDRTVSGHGHVSVVHRDTRMTCDRAVVYLATHDVFLSGRVRVEQPGGTMTGEDVLYNLETRKGTILRAEATVAPWRGIGDRLERAADQGVVARGGSATTCDFTPPHTRLQAREVRIIPDDRVIIKGAVMYIGALPVFYLPSYTHPLNDRRPRVTLTPGYSGEWGGFLLTSWRYFLHEHLQGRIHVDYRERRHFGEGIDTKYRLGTDNDGLLRFYYTHEHALEKGHRYTRPKKAPTISEERYRVQWRHRWELDPDTTATVELHQAKDAEFLQDYFEREYEQDIEPKTYVQIVRSAPRYGLSLVGRKRVNRYAAEIEQLPELRYDIRPTAIPWRAPWRVLAPWQEEDDWSDERNLLPGSRWYYQSSQSYNAFYRKLAHQGGGDHVRRLDTRQELAYQARLLGALNVTPSMATRQTWYSEGIVRDGDVFRGAFEIGLDVSTKFFRIFNMEYTQAGFEIHRLRHVITPSIAYRYQPPPTVPKDRLFQFDGLDSLDRSHMITPSIEQKLQTKRPATGVAHATAKDMKSVDLVRFVLGTDYTFRAKNDTGGQMGNVTGDLELRPYDWLLVESDTTLTTHRRQLASWNFDIAGGPGIGTGTSGVAMAQEGRWATSDTELPWAVGAGWRWQRDGNVQATTELVFNVGAKWRLGLYERLDIRRINADGSKFIKRPAESEFRIRRDLHEWTVELIMNRQRTEGNLLLLLFRLKAAPDQPLEFERNFNRPKLGTRRALFTG